MKKLLIVFIGYFLSSCGAKPDYDVIAKLRITQCSDKEKGGNILLLTTIYENKTGEDIYLIKSHPLSTLFSKENNDTVANDLGQDLGFMPELDSRCLRNSVHQGNYLEKVTDAFPDKKRIVDSIAVLNKEDIKIEYGGYPYKFKSQLLVLKKGEILEVDNVLVTGDLKKILKYKFDSKASNELERRIKLGENIIVPQKIGKYSFWDGEIKLNSEEIEVLFKKI